MESDCHEKWVLSPKSSALFVLSGVLRSTLENPRERFIIRAGRTHIRSRSPR